jgi:hypothetical protein
VFLIVGIVQAVVMMSMFGDFYYKAYVKSKTSPWWTSCSCGMLFEELKIELPKEFSKWFKEFHNFIDNILNLDVNILVWMPNAQLLNYVKN